MALERNNTARQFDPGFDPEFERMLQHHLRRGGAPVAACSGFDADTASAFLENVLTQSARSRYESHLAGCPTCRRHLIELSQLVQSFPQIDALPAPGKAQPPPVLKGKSAVWKWFDFSQWGWDWQSAGLAGAAMIVLIMAFSLPLWRRANSPAPRYETAALPPAQTEASPTPSSGGAPASQFYETAAQTEASLAPSSGGAPASQFADSAPNQLVIEQGQTPGDGAGHLVGRELLAASKRRPVIPPLSDSLRPSHQEPELLRAAPSSAPTPRLSNLAGGAFEVAEVARESMTKRSLRAFRSELPEPTIAPTPPEPVSVAAPPPENETRARPEAPAPPSNIIDPPVGPSPDDNPMRTEKGPSKPANQQPERLKTKPIYIDLARALAPTRKGDRDVKTADMRSDDEDIRPLFTRINGKPFSRENRAEGRIWVDQEYNRQAWLGVTVLVQGSDEFEHVLKEEPRLKPFFDKAPIIVVWGNKIYKVVLKMRGAILPRSIKGSIKGGQK